jgi:hypothetical protein
MSCTCKESNDVHPVTTNACSNYAVHSGGAEVSSLMACYTVWTGNCILAFRKTVFPSFPSSPVAFVCLTMKIKAVRPFETSIIYLPVDTAQHPRRLEVCAVVKYLRIRIFISGCKVMVKLSAPLYRH